MGFCPSDDAGDGSPEHARPFFHGLDQGLHNEAPGKTSREMLDRSNAGCFRAQFGRFSVMAVR
jgi:hypothetical protein